jgi:hypothetical protein
MATSLSLLTAVATALAYLTSLASHAGLRNRVGFAEHLEVMGKPSGLAVRLLVVNVVFLRPNGHARKVEAFALHAEGAGVWLVAKDVERRSANLVAAGDTHVGGAKNVLG